MPTIRPAVPKEYWCREENGFKKYKTIYMQSDYSNIPFSKAIMTGLFIGIIDTVICLIFNLVYRYFTGYPLSAFINVSTLIFAVNLLFPVIGIVYFLFKRAFPKNDIVFIIVFVLLTIFFSWKAESINRSPIHAFTIGFRGLLLGIVIILGGTAAFGLPLLYHSKKFEEGVL
jgi:hypothetical protein